MRRAGVFLMACLFVATTPVAVAGQSGAWRFALGGGLSSGLYRGDSGDQTRGGGVARASITYPIGDVVGVGLEWLGAWRPGSFGAESSHHLSLAMLTVPGLERPGIRLGLGLGTTTVVHADGPPGSIPAGDLDIDRGGELGVSALAEVEWLISLGSRLAVVPAVGVLGQRAAGAGFVRGVITMRLSGG